MSLSEENQKINKALDKILSSQSGSKEAQEGIDLMNEVLIKNDKHNIIRRYFRFLDNAEHLRDNQQLKGDPNIEIAIQDVVELNNLLKHIDNQ